MGIQQLNTQIEDHREQTIRPVPGQEINWEELLLQLRHLEIRILECLYLPEPRPLAFETLYQKTQRLGYSAKTLRRKIKRLESLGLIDVIRSTVMIINPVLRLEKNIKTLTILWNHRDRNF